MKTKIISILKPELKLPKTEFRYLKSSSRLNYHHQNDTFVYTFEICRWSWNSR